MNPYIMILAIWLILSFWSRNDSFHFHYSPIIINMSHIIWLFIISPMEMAILHVKLDWLLDALWRPLFLVIESSWSQLGTSSKMDSGRLKLYTKSLRNFNKIYAFRPEPNLELFQVQIRTDLYLYRYASKVHSKILFEADFDWITPASNCILYL